MLGMILSLQSCLKDDRNDCAEDVPNLRILIETLEGISRAGSEHYNIDNVFLYIFDMQERYVGTWQGGAYTPGQEYAVELEIDPGIYHFIAWTNQNISYAPSGDPGSADELIVGLQYPEDGKITDDMADLHHGMLTDAHVVANRNNEFTITIKPDTYRLNFTVGGIPASGDDYSFTVKDNNTHYLFDNSIVEGMNEVEYTRTARFADGLLKASMKVLRLTEDRTPLFDFMDLTTDESLYSGDLVQMIKKAYADSGQRVDFDREFEFDIKLEFDENLGLTVSVNGWDYNGNPTEL